VVVVMRMSTVASGPHPPPIQLACQKEMKSLTDRKIDAESLYLPIVKRIQPAMALAQDRCDQAHWSFVGGGVLAVSCIGRFCLTLSCCLYQPITWYLSFRNILCFTKLDCFELLLMFGSPFISARYVSPFLNVLATLPEGQRVALM
jgi:hypothetical protein